MYPQTPFRISVKTLQNLEEVLAAEMAALQVSQIEIGRRVVHCVGDMADVYKLNLHLRTALRVLIPVVEFPIREPDDIHKQAIKHDWTQYLSVDETFAIDPNVNSEFIRHSNYASVKLKDAIADCFRNKYNRRPDVDADSPHVLFHLHVDQHRVTIALDSSGSTLNRRGYRNKGARAPINEVLAAGMLMLTEWRGECDFYDPMCGSGTLAIEAAMIAANMPAQSFRNDFGFMHWNSFDKALWSKTKSEATKNIRPMPCKIYASDADKWQLRSAQDNIENTGFEEEIKLELLDFFERKPIGEKGIIVMNPPYGERMDEGNMEILYKNIGDHLKHHWPGYSAWLISSNEDAIKKIGLKPSKKIPLINGTLPCKFIRIDLFAGKRADWKTKQ
jgi:putative N6-adenine-specific DNA methylase